MIHRSLLLFASLFLLSPAVAHADVSPTDRAVARTLFEEGRRFFKQGSYEKACPKFAESMRLDPASGTQLNLAVCHERIGRTATAWSEYNDAVTRARQDRRPDREKLARERIAALEPRLSRLEVIVPEASRIEGLRIMLGDAEIREAAWGVATPIDPGEHEVRAAAPGHEPWSARVHVGAESDRQILEVPLLQRVSRPAAQPKQRVARSAEAARDEPGPSSQATVGWVVGGVGLVAVGAGSYFGWQASSKWSEVERVCPGGGCPDDEARQANAGLRDEASRSGNVSTVAFVAGGALLAAGGWLILSADATGREGSVALSPAAPGAVAGATLRGGF